jgi:nitrogen fixation protein NifX
MRIAFATHDLRTMDAHFGGARNFAIYSVSTEEYHFVEAIRFDESSGEDGVHADSNDDRITPRVDAIDGCALLFVLAIGGPAAAKVVNRRIHPVKLPHPEPIDQVLERVQAMLRTSPPPWLRKAMGGDTPKSLDFLDEDLEERA